MAAPLGNTELTDIGYDLRACAEDAKNMTPVDMALLVRMLSASSRSTEQYVADLERAVRQTRLTIPAAPRARGFGG